MRIARSTLIALALLAISGVVLYRDVVERLVYDWAHDDNYSHGFLIVPLAAYLTWERRARLRRAQSRPSVIGVAIVVFSLAAFIAGIVGAELFVSRISVVGVLAGTVLFILGWEHLRVVVFPLALLFLMIPIPAIIFNQIAFPLQLLASRFGETALSAANIPVLREGNVIILANTSLEVAEACSGIRSLISLLTLAIVYGYFADRRAWIRITVALATVPIAIATNGLRVAGTGIAAHYYGPEAAEGFFHTFSGWLIFVLAFVMLFGVVRFVVWFFPQPVSTAHPGQIEPTTQVA